MCQQTWEPSELWYPRCFDLPTGMPRCGELSLPLMTFECLSVSKHPQITLVRSGPAFEPACLVTWKCSHLRWCYCSTTTAGVSCGKCGWSARPLGQQCLYAVWPGRLHGQPHAWTWLYTWSAWSQVITTQAFCPTNQPLTQCHRGVPCAPCVHYMLT